MVNDVFVAAIVSGSCVCVVVDKGSTEIDAVYALKDVARIPNSIDTASASVEQKTPQKVCFNW